MDTKYHLPSHSWTMVLSRGSGSRKHQYFTSLWYSPESIWTGWASNSGRPLHLGLHQNPKMPDWSMIAASPRFIRTSDEIRNWDESSLAWDQISEKWTLGDWEPICTPTGICKPNQWMQSVNSTEICSPVRRLRILWFEINGREINFMPDMSKNSHSIFFWSYYGLSGHMRMYSNDYYFFSMFVITVLMFFFLFVAIIHFTPV